MASALTLDQSGDFDATVRAAGDYFKILPALIAKDYWVTRVLRALATEPPLKNTTLFKGGTSLSKGWKLIDRFSEDIDLLLTDPTFAEQASDGARRKKYEAVQKRVEAETPLTLPSKTAVSAKLWKHLYKSGSHHRQIRYPLPGFVPQLASANTEWLLVEMGHLGGVQPWEERQLNSMIGDFLLNTRVPAELESYRGDFAPFAMLLLKPERTLAEKLLYLHEALSRGDDGAAAVKTRYLYDVTRVFAKSDAVRTACAEGEMARLFRDAAEVSNEQFRGQFKLDALDLKASSVFSVTDSQSRILRANYENENERSLYFAAQPPFDTILRGLADVHAAVSLAKAA